VPWEVLAVTLIACVAHHARLESPTIRQADAVFIDHGNHGSLWNHRRALEWAADQSERVWIVEDDAILCEGFRDRGADWARRFPDDLISGYLGTGRPPQWQSTIRRRLDAAEASARDFVELPTLIHGVCYSLPTRARLALPSARRAADEAIGRAWARRVIYTVPSLADHSDGRSVEIHPDGQPRNEIRRAWRFVS